MYCKNWVIWLLIQISLFIFYCYEDDCFLSLECCDVQGYSLVLTNLFFLHSQPNIHLFLFTFVTFHFHFKQISPSPFLCVVLPQPLSLHPPSHLDKLYLSTSLIHSFTPSLSLSLSLILSLTLSLFSATTTILYRNLSCHFQSSFSLEFVVCFPSCCNSLIPFGFLKSSQEFLSPLLLHSQTESERPLVSNL